jgi:hypothetical protein
MATKTLEGFASLGGGGRGWRSKIALGGELARVEQVTSRVTSLLGGTRYRRGF